MLEMIIFAVVLAIALCVGNYIMTMVMVKHFMSKRFIKKYTKMMVSTIEDIQEEMEDIL